MDILSLGPPPPIRGPVQEAGSYTGVKHRRLHSVFGETVMWEQPF